MKWVRFCAVTKSDLYFHLQTIAYDGEQTLEALIKFVKRLVWGETDDGGDGDSNIDSLMEDTKDEL